MTGTHPNTAETLLIALGDLHELVRGEEQILLQSVGPLVLEHNVYLDLSRVERMDAAGIATLIALYSSARNAGHEFALTNAPHRIREILALVGLEQILISHNADPKPHSEPQLERSAA